eukprot:scaffold2842_cov373-Prasinococcus_capsulatus_cf.AAC.1
MHRAVRRAATTSGRSVSASCSAPRRSGRLPAVVMRCCACRPVRHRMMLRLGRVSLSGRFRPRARSSLEGRPSRELRAAAKGDDDDDDDDHRSPLRADLAFQRHARSVRRRQGCISNAHVRQASHTSAALRPAR